MAEIGVQSGRTANWLNSTHTTLSEIDHPARVVIATEIEIRADER